jgi:hypothetical protein
MNTSEKYHSQVKGTKEIWFLGDMADFRAEVGKLQQPPINMKMRKKINE